MAESANAGPDGSSADSEVTSLGLVTGAFAYLLGLAGTLGIARTGLLADAGAWQRVGETLDGQVLAHQSAHVPLWNARPHPEMLPVTAILLVIVAVAGFVVARQAETLDSREEAFRSGGSVVVGYLPLTVLASLYLVLRGAGVEWVALIAPTLLAGVVFPAVVGGLGGVGAAIVDERRGPTR